jgi:hypothetical protein
VTQVLERVPVDRITAEAKDIRFWHTIATVVAGFFWLIGWLVSKVWLGIAWCAVAVKVGWQDARTPRPGGSP